MTKLKAIEPARNDDHGRQTFTDSALLLGAVEAWATKQVREIMNASGSDHTTQASDADLKRMATELREELAPYEHEKVARGVCAKLQAALGAVEELNRDRQEWQSGNWTSLLRRIAPVAADLARELRDGAPPEQPKWGELRLFVMQLADIDSSGQIRWGSACGSLRDGLRARSEEKRDLDALVVLAGFFDTTDAESTIKATQNRKVDRGHAATGATVNDALERLKVRDVLAEIRSP
jgi:hypothetical protein